MAESLNIDISKFVADAAKEDIEKKYSLNVLMKMLIEGLHTDITLKVEESCVRAHRCVLAGASSVFHAMFKQGMKERISLTVEISDLSMEALQLFLVLLYVTNERNVAVPEFEAAVKKHSVEFFRACQKYDVVERLKCILAKADLPRVLTPDNCWDYGRITSLSQNVNHDALFVKFMIDCGMSGPSRVDIERPCYVCYKFIVQNFDEVVESNSTLQEM